MVETVCVFFKQSSCKYNCNLKCTSSFAYQLSFAPLLAMKFPHAIFFFNERDCTGVIEGVIRYQ